MTWGMLWKAMIITLLAVIAWMLFVGAVVMVLIADGRVAAGNSPVRPSGDPGDGGFYRQRIPEIGRKAREMRRDHGRAS